MNFKLDIGHGGQEVRDPSMFTFTKISGYLDLCV